MMISCCTLPVVGCMSMSDRSILRVEFVRPVGDSDGSNNKFHKLLGDDC